MCIRDSFRVLRTCRGRTIGMPGRSVPGRGSLAVVQIPAPSGQGAARGDYIDSRLDRTGVIPDRSCPGSFGCPIC
eukprot:7047755-Pyramimonas_sp.AAC.1